MRGSGNQQGEFQLTSFVTIDPTPRQSIQIPNDYDHTRDGEHVIHATNRYEYHHRHQFVLYPAPSCHVSRLEECIRSFGSETEVVWSLVVFRGLRVRIGITDAWEDEPSDHGGGGSRAAECLVNTCYNK